MATLLRQRILALKIPNWRGENFVLIQSLLNVLDEETVRQVLRECGIEVYQQEEALKAVRNGGNRVFAILSVMEREKLIVDFIKQDGFLGSELDSRLNYEEDFLKRIIPGDYRSFYDNQWTFSAPVFRPNLYYRHLSDKCILPYTEVLDLGKGGVGGFGVVCKVSLPGSHQGFIQDEKGKVELIRKELKDNTAEKDFENEQHILSLLRCLQHPYIIQFYAAYTIGRQNPTLLLEPAEYDLAIFLSLARPPIFIDETIFHALFGLASAIEHVHNYFSDEYNLRMVGCHYDLKPKNVLVKNDHFVLSDFGLSRLKLEAQGSDSSFKGGIGDYLAPECQNLTGDFAKNRIRRSSDIWSFGCILAEMATYIDKGSSGVDAFARARQIKLAGFLTLHTFHSGGAPHKEVVTWIDELERSASSYEHRRGLLYLVRDMLTFEASKRPDAGEVAARLFLLAQRTTYDAITERLKLLLPKFEWNTRVQYKRLKFWAQAVGFHDISPAGQRSSWFCQSGVQIYFDRIQHLLQDISKDLSLQAELCHLEPHRASSSANHRILRTRVDGLWDTQPQTTVSIMNDQLESFLLSEVDTADLSLAVEGIADYRRILSLIAMKQASISLGNLVPQQRNFLIDGSVVKGIGEVKGRKLGYIDNSENRKVFTFTEMLEYQDAWIDRSDALIKRVNGLVSLLNKPDISETLPLLQCRNFYHIPEDQAFGLVYQIPDRFVHGSRPPQPITLADMIRNTQSRSKRPVLDEIFLLAHTLATSVQKFHKAGWLHKSISAFNLLFFPDGPEAPGSAITSPYIVGFSHSRESDENAFTVGPTQNMEQADYQHPEYRDADSKECFREEFDYYSVGIVLLELGRWKLLRHLTTGKQTHSPVQLKDHLLAKEVPQLGSYMGQTYRNAVATCLDGTLAVGKRGNSIRARFEEKVVQPLAKCLVLHLGAVQSQP